jgi:hypothetical protein
MRLHPHEFIKRFLMHVLPKGFHRIRQNPQNTAIFRRFYGTPMPLSMPSHEFAIIKETIKEDEGRRRNGAGLTGSP